jgi:hypothetical protein
MEVSPLENKKIKLSVPNLEGQLSIMFTRGGPRDGAGRKAIGETKKISLTLSNETWKEIEERCNLLSCSRSEVLREMIESWFLSNKSEG